MYVLLLAVLQWMHILGGIFWFGGVLTTDFVILPAIQGLPSATQHAFVGPFVRQAEKVVVPVATATILLGLIRGIVGGVLGSLTTPYGLTWIAAFIVGSSLLFFGLRILTPAANKLLEMPPGPEFDAALPRVRRLTLAELGGFALILTLMIAMRFGY